MVCDGTLEGYIRNLQPTSYYQVRAFYKSVSGKEYYGGWVTFDPSDFSFFEPTVRTYPVQEVSTRSAVVKGYALPGTDQITAQGFQYWRSGSVNDRKNVPADSEIFTVKAKGQMMIATFDELEPETQYTFRVFVETTRGITYGDEQTFTTEYDPSGVECINDDNNPPIKIIGYYNMMGLHADKPHIGLNIIVFSDGTSKKLMIRQ